MGVMAQRVGNVTVPRLDEYMYLQRRIVIDGILIMMAKIYTDRFKICLLLKSATHEKECRDLQEQSCAPCC